MKTSIQTVETIRDESNFQIDYKLARSLGATLNKIKGRVDQQLAQSGKLDTNEFIKFRINRKAGEIPSFNIFNQTIEKNGLDVYLLLDCSYSMSLTYGKMTNIASTIFQALENCSFINFKCVCYSGSFDHTVYIQEIDKVSDCKFITPDRRNRGTPTHLVLNYIHDKIKKLENKKLVILFTDGLPEDRLSYETMQEEIKKEVIKMKNDKINFFTLFYQNYAYNGDSKLNPKLTKDITEKMRNMFKGSLYQTDDFKKVQKVLIKQLIKSVENINSSG